MDTKAPATRLVVIAASKGGFQALREIVAALPADFAPAIAIVLHHAACPPGRDPLVGLLGRVSTLPVVEAVDGDVPRRGTIYVAPGDRHLTLATNGHWRLVDGQRMRHVHSSANPLFDTAAHVFGDRLVGVVLTGGDHDASEGVQSIARAGGVVIAEDPRTANAPGMPASAIATGAVDRILALESIVPALVEIVAVTPPPRPGPSSSARRCS